MSLYTISEILSDNRFKEPVKYWSGIRESTIIYGEFPKENIVHKHTGRQCTRVVLSQHIAENILEKCIGSVKGLVVFGIAGLYYLLWKYTGATRTTVGVWNENKYNEILPFTCELSGQLSFIDWLETIKNSYILTYKYNVLPVNIRDYLLDPEEPERVAKDIKILVGHGKLSEPEQEGKFCLNLEIQEKKVIITARYDAENYEPKYVKKILDYFEQFLGIALQNPQIKLDEINLLLEPVCIKDLGTYENNKTLDQVFADQVKLNSEAIALKFGTDTMTYGQLEEKSWVLASQLVKIGVKPEELVGLMLDKSMEMIITIIAVLKVGGAYVPIDPNYPKERKAFILKDAGVKVLLTNTKEVKLEFSIAVYDVYQLIKEYSDDKNPIRLSKPNDLAYIIYTSGTTGKPKGVMITHQNVLSLIKSNNNKFDFNPQDRWLLFHSYCFDVSVWEIFGTLLTGGCLFIAPDEVIKNGLLLASFINEMEITILNQTPSAFFRLLNDVVIESEFYKKLRYIIFAGEALYPIALKAWNTRYPHIKILNLYGITEITIHGTYKEITDVEIQHNCSNIGEPFNTLEFRLLDENQKPVADGMIGEIYVRGHGVAKGYLNSKELTAERFIKLPNFGDEIYYKSGDMARKRITGEYEYMGRNDDQIKINGYRVEVEEIQRYISTYPGVITSVVIFDREGDSKKLYGFYTSQSPVSNEEIYRFLRKQLPQYMIPAHLVWIDEIPLTSNGKVDKRALLKLQRRENNVYVLPQTTEEKVLADIWKTVLNKDNISIHDNYFALGGDSISGFLIISKLKNYNRTIELSELFEYPTIYQLAKHVKAIGIAKEGKVVEGIVALTPIQKWFLNTPQIQPFIRWQKVLLKGIKKIDDLALEKAVDHLLKHHDSLRVVGHQQNGTFYLYNYSQMSIKNVLKISEYDNEISLESATRLLDETLSNEFNGSSFIHVNLLKGVDSDFIYIQIHHMIIDMVSWRILLEDFLQCYTAYTTSLREPKLDKTIDYKDWSDLLQEEKTIELFQNQAGYWRDLDERACKNIVFKNNVHNEDGSIIISKKITNEKILEDFEKANRKHHTQVHDLLLSALVMTLQNFKTGNWIIDLESHGRVALNPNIKLDRTVGWFTALYPLELPVSSEMNVLISMIKEALKAVQDSGVGYGVLHYNANNGDDKARSYPEVLFNYLGLWNDTHMTSFEIIKLPNHQELITKSSPYALMINCSLQKDGLDIEIVFDRKRIDETRGQFILQCFENDLAEVLDYCLQEGEIIKTPSDYGTTDIDQKDLQQVLDQLQEEPRWIYTLSPMQKGILYQHQLSSQGGVYTIQQMYGIQGSVSFEGLEESLRILIQNYEILRTRIIYKGITCPVQCVIKEGYTNIKYVDLSYLEPMDQKQAIETILEEDFYTRFELEKAPYRVTLIQLNDRNYKLLWSVHHIIIDGWGLITLFNTLLKIYTHIELKKPICLKPNPTYKQYIDWVRRQDQQKSLFFWKEYLSGVENSTYLYGDFGKKTFNSRGAIKFCWTLEGEELEYFKTFCQQCQVTLNQALLSLWGLVLQKFTNSDDVVFGSVHTIRPAEIFEVEEMVGIFINTLPTRVRIDVDKSFFEFVQETKKDLLDIQKNAYCSLADIMNCTQVKSQLINHLFIYENYPQNDIKLEELPNINLTSSYSNEQTQYDLDLSVYPSEKLTFEIKYNPSKYSETYVSALSHTVMGMLREVINNPTISVTDLRAGINTASSSLSFTHISDIPKLCQYTAHECFENYAMTQPDQIAVTSNQESLTYKELNLRANIVAKVLRNKQIGREDIVAVWMERSVNVFVVLLGIWKAGAAYLPIDRNCPEGWVMNTIEEAGVQCVLTDIFSYSENSSEVFYYIGNLDFDQKVDKIESLNQPQDLAYVISTSGTTGKPKLVMVEHRNLLAMVDAWIRSYDIKEQEINTILQLANISFDVFTGDMARSLLVGGRMIMATEEERMDLKKIYELLTKYAVNMVETTPAVGIPLLKMVSKKEWTLPNLKLFVLGSDTLPVKEFEDLWNTFGSQFRIINSYGTTEATIDSSYYEPTAEELMNWVTIPIGKPMYNVVMYILDKALNQVPVGVEGELYIGGYGVARGYMNESSNKGKFIDNPFGNSTKIYRTGDYARVLYDGNIQLLGRKDEQVKIRGMRVEIKEIEECYKKYYDILDVVVIGYDNKVNSNVMTGLALFYTAHVNISDKELKAHGVKNLKPWMIPNRYQRVEKIPLTVSNKIDKMALLNTLLKSSNDITLKEPNNKWEEKLLVLWQQVFHQQKIGVDQDFFELGGHSILLMKLAAQIYQEFDIHIELNDIFILNTIEKMANYMQEYEYKQSIKYPEIDLQALKEVTTFPLTEIQRAYMVGRSQVFEIGNVAAHSYEVVEGTFNIALLEQAVNKVIERHDMIRAVFLPDGTQKILDKASYHIAVEDLCYMEEKEREQRLELEGKRIANQVLDPQQWPLFEIKGFKLGEKYYRIAMGVDSLFADDLSSQKIISEIVQFYLNPQLILKPLTYSFKAYVLTLEMMKKSKYYTADRDFWMNQLKDIAPAPQLPYKVNLNTIKKPHFSRISSFISKEEYEIIKAEGIRQQVLPTVVLATVYAEVLSKWSNQNELTINLTLSNRFPFHEEVNEIVGDFTSTMLLSFHGLQREQSFWEKAKITQNILNEYMQHRYFDGVEVLRELAKKAKQSGKALMPVVLTSMLGESKERQLIEEVKFFKRIESINQTSQVILDNQISETSEGINIIWDYVEELFSFEVIQSMHNYFTQRVIQIAKGIIHHETEEEHKIIEAYEAFNYTKGITNNSQLNQGFEQAVLLHGKRIACKFKDDSLTYEELNCKANQVANYLKTLEISKGDFVGILTARKLESIINILGVLKVGAAYVPVDPTYPQNRQEYIISHSGCKAVLAPDIYDKKSLYALSTEFDAVEVDLDNVSYVIYTSGSSGLPKGVAITHGAVVNTLANMQNNFAISSEDKILGVSSFAFDLSVYDLFGIFRAGATYVMIEDTRDIKGLIQTLKAEGITIWNSVPAVMEALIKKSQIGEDFNSLRLVFLSGDWIPISLPKQIYQKTQDCQVISLGGATEASIWSIFYPIAADEAFTKSVPYGRPLGNQRWYILNEIGKLCPVSVPGELYIGGKGLAKGYHNEPELTRESFVRHLSLGLLYKTGDYGVLHPNGTIEFLGRKDNQVKINGFRIEINEIESQLLKYPQINNAVVVVKEREDGERYLCGFYSGSSMLSTDELKSYLRDRIPEYMIPLIFVRLEEIPLSPNDKVDRKLLSQLYIKDLVHAGIKNPDTTEEKIIADIWSELLGREDFGIYCDFFELGGDSIKAVELAQQINRSLDIVITVAEIYTHATIKSLAELILKSRNELKLMSTS